MISNDIRYVGVNDHQVDPFEAQYVVPNGMAYNSYVILDEKVAVMDTVDTHFGAQWLENIAAVLGDRQPDYLVVQHMEPDHSANIQLFLERYPQAALVGNAKTFVMMGQFFPTLPACAKVTVTDGQTLSLGKHSLTFVFAPMVHWPEVMVTYDETDKILFSADAFGSFHSLDGNLFNDEVNYDRDWLDEARRYYANIVGKYGVMVQNALKKLSGLELAYICPLHGLVWRSEFEYLLAKYTKWSRYDAESDGVIVIC